MSNIRNILIDCFEKCKTTTTKDILTKPDNKTVGYSGFFHVDDYYFTKRSMVMFKYEIGTYKIGSKQIKRRKSK